MFKIFRTKQKGAHEHTSAQHLKGEKPASAKTSASAKASATAKTRLPGRDYPPYVCDDLIKNYLRKEQEEAVRPVLRVLKKEYQVELGTSLMD